MNIYSAEPNDPQTFADDILLEDRRKPDHEIKILGLDEKKILEWWLNFKKSNKWKTLSENCSTVVADAMKIGKGEKYASWSKSHNVVWTPNDVKEFANSIKDTFNKLNPNHGVTRTW